MRDFTLPVRGKRQHWNNAKSRQCKKCDQELRAIRKLEDYDLARASDRRRVDWRQAATIGSRCLRASTAVRRRLLLTAWVSPRPGLQSSAVARSRANTLSHDSCGQGLRARVHIQGASKLSHRSSVGRCQQKGADSRARDSVKGADPRKAALGTMRRRHMIKKPLIPSRTRSRGRVHRRTCPSSVRNHCARCPLTIFPF